MTEVAIITDIHFDVRNGSSYFASKYLQFFENVFFPELQRRNIKTVWILGDTWEYRTKIHAASLNFALSSFFDRLAAADIKVIMIYGNHDVAFRTDNSVNTIDFLGDMYPNIHVVRDFETIMHDDVPVHFVSWINKSNSEEMFRKIAEVTPSILCGHLEVNGFETTRGITAHGMMEPTLFDRFQRVFSGHFHIRANRGSIYYLGNPFQTNWGDYGYDRGFHIFDPSSLDLQFIKNPFEVYAVIEYDDGTDIDAFPYEQYAEKIVRVYIPSYRDVNPGKLGIFNERLQSTTKLAEVVEQSKESRLQMDLDMSSHFDNRTLINSYIDQMDTPKSIDKDKLSRLFMNVYNEALTMVERE